MAERIGVDISTRAAVNKYDNGGWSERERERERGAIWEIPLYKSDHQKRRPVIVRTSRMSRGHVYAYVHRYILSARIPFPPFLRTRTHTHVYVAKGIATREESVLLVRFFSVPREASPNRCDRIESGRIRISVSVIKRSIETLLVLLEYRPLSRLPRLLSSFPDPPPPPSSSRTSLVVICALIRRVSGARSGSQRTYERVTHLRSDVRVPATRRGAPRRSN